MEQAVMTLLERCRSYEQADEPGFSQILDEYCRLFPAKVAALGSVLTVMPSVIAKWRTGRAVPSSHVRLGVVKAVGRLLADGSV